MAKPFFERLRDYYLEVGKVLRSEASASSIFPNTTDIGMSRERIYARVLKDHLPASCGVKLGGFLFDQRGNESKQLDIIITESNSMQYEFSSRDGSGKSFACIDGCVGAISVKSKLGTRELRDGLANLASLPSKQPLTPDRHAPGLVIRDYEDWPYKAIFAQDGIDISGLVACLKDFY